MINMNRRGMFGSLAASFAAFVGFKPKASASTPKADWTVPSEYDPTGLAICRIYRRCEDERTGRRSYVEIRRDEIRIGDHIICVGVVDGRLFKCESGTVRELLKPDEKNNFAGGYIAEPETEKYLLG
jgi:hypothetical protein